MISNEKVARLTVSNEKGVSSTLSNKSATNWTVSNDSGNLDIFWMKRKQAHHFWKSDKVSSLTVSNKKSRKLDRFKWKSEKLESFE